MVQAQRTQAPWAPEFTAGYRDIGEIGRLIASSMDPRERTPEAAAGYAFALGVATAVLNEQWARDMVHGLGLDGSRLTEMLAQAITEKWDPCQQQAPAVQRRGRVFIRAAAS